MTLPKASRWPRTRDQVAADPLVLHRYRTAYAPLVWEGIEQSRATLKPWVPQIAGLRTLDEVATGLAGLEQAWDEGRKRVYAVFRRDDGWFVGEVGLYDIDESRRAATIGLWLRDSARRRGYGVRAFAALAGHALDVLGMDVLEARVHPANERSRRLVQRVGFQLVGTAPAIPESEGDAPRVLVYQLLASARGLQHSGRARPV